MRLEFIKYWDPFCAGELNYGMPIILSVGTFWEKNVKHWDSFTQVSWNVYTYACSIWCKKVLRQFSLLLGPICLGGSGELHCISLRVVDYSCQNCQKQTCIQAYLQCYTKLAFNALTKSHNILWGDSFQIILI